MELVAAAFFIPLIIIALTQFVKMKFKAVEGWLTIVVAFVVGILVALVDQLIGVTDINIAQGLVFALEAIGLTAIAGKAGGGTAGDANSAPTVR